MKKLRKGANCLNCGLVLDKKYNYCPQCGQENTNNKASVRVLVWDTILNYFSFDMLFGRSVIPFLFCPGYLVKAFLDGNRVGHIHPVRLYLLVNFLFFLIFVRTIDLKKIERLTSTNSDEDKPQLVTKAWLYNGEDTTVMSMKELADSLKINRKGITNRDSLENLLSKKIKEGKLLTNYEFKQEIKNDSVSIGLGWEKKISWRQFLKFVGRKDLTPSEFLDSLGVENKSEIALRSGAQAMKIGRNDMSMFVLNIINNIPLMMILMLPLIAFYLKFFYIFSKRLYVEHLVFTFHFQSFIYFILSILLLLFYTFEISSEDTIVTVISCATFVWLAHTFFAFRKVYQQSWWFTLFKMFWLVVFYIATFAFFFIVEMTYSFFTY